MDLIDAILKNNFTRVKELLEQGADPNMVLDEACVTPLHFAAQKSSITYNGRGRYR